MKRIEVLARVVFGLIAISLVQQFFADGLDCGATTAWGQSVAAVQPSDASNAKEDIAATLKKDLTKAKSSNLIDEGTKLFKQNRYEDALKKFQQASYESPGNADAYYHIAATYHQLGKQRNSSAYLKLAEDYYNRCLDRNENHVECFRGMAALLSEGGRTQVAFRLLQSWESRQPKSIDAKIELARLSEETGNKDAAKSYLLEALAIEKDNPRAQAALAKLQEDTDEYPAVLANKQKTEKADKENKQPIGGIARLQMPSPPTLYSPAGIAPPRPTPTTATAPVAANSYTTSPVVPYMTTSGPIASAYAPNQPNKNFAPQKQPKPNEPDSSRYGMPTYVAGPYTAQPVYNGPYPSTIPNAPAQPAQGAYQPAYQSPYPQYNIAPQPQPNMPRTEEKVHTVCHLKSVPAATLANALNSLFTADTNLDPMHGVTIVPETVSNSLLVGGPKSRVEVVLDMVKDMDLPVATVEVELQISESGSPKAEKTDVPAPAKEETDEEAAKGQLTVSPDSPEGKVLFRAVVSTLNNQEASISVTRQEPQIVGMSRGPAGMTANSVNMMGVGTQLTLTPRIEGDKAVVLALKISESRLDRGEDGAVIGQSKDNRPIMTPSTEQFTAQTTVRLEDAKPVILGGLKTNGQTRTISVTARIIRPGETKPARHGEKKL